LDTKQADVEKDVDNGKKYGKLSFVVNEGLEVEGRKV
jgi:hypothetical protein